MAYTAETKEKQLFHRHGSQALKQWRIPQARQPHNPQSTATPPRSQEQRPPPSPLFLPHSSSPPEEPPPLPMASRSSASLALSSWFSTHLATLSLSALRTSSKPLLNFPGKPHFPGKLNISRVWMRVEVCSLILRWLVRNCRTQFFSCPKNPIRLRPRTLRFK